MFVPFKYTYLMIHVSFIMLLNKFVCESDSLRKFDTDKKFNIKLYQISRRQNLQRRKAVMAVSLSVIVKYESDKDKTRKKWVLLRVWVESYRGPSVS